MLDFDYIKPNNLEEIGTILAETQPVPRILAGGTDILLEIEREPASTGLLVDIKGLPDIDTITYSTNTGLTIGAATTLTGLFIHPDVLRRYPLLADACAAISSPQVRNRATIGGHLCVASPTSALAPALLCYNAELPLWHLDDVRTLALHDFYTGSKQTALESGELILRVILPPPPSSSAGIYEILENGQSGISTFIGAAMMARKTEDTFSDWRIALTGANPIPSRFERAEAMLAESALNAKTITAAADAIMQELQPPDDHLASESYRRAMAGVLVQRGIEAVIAKLS